jgi:hypothetical protein
MMQLSVYSSVTGELPKMVVKGEAKTFVPWSEVLELKNKLCEIYSDTSHTQYENSCYADFLLRKVGLK